MQGGAVWSTFLQAPVVWSNRLRAPNSFEQLLEGPEGDAALPPPRTPRWRLQRNIASAIQGGPAGRS
eukprot:343964-Alexandrium_andersonii.AAC.1